MSSTPPSIGLEISRKGKIGCGISVFAFILVIVGFVSFSYRSGQANARASTVRAYEMATRGEFAGMKGFVSESGVLTLQKAEAERGRVSEFKIESEATQFSGRPSYLVVDVVRGGKDYVAEVALQNSAEVSVIVEYTKADWDAKRLEKGLRVIAK